MLCCALRGTGARAMKLLYSAVFKAGSATADGSGPVMMTSAAELSSFGYFQRRSVKEMCATAPASAARAPSRARAGKPKSAPRRRRRRCRARRVTVPLVAARGKWPTTVPTPRPRMIQTRRAV